MPEPLSPLHSQHPRTYRENQFVYPVLSRRARGISIGVNLNPDKNCNFNCLYCQVDRQTEAAVRFVETDRLLAELDAMLAYVSSGALYDDPQFRTVPSDLRRLNDIAFSGDGEPTIFRNFDAIVKDAVRLKQEHTLHDTKIVLITNASMLHRPAVQRALDLLDENNGEIWAKLEAGTEAYYQQVAQTTVPFQRILDNITDAARQHPLVIQSLFMNIDGLPPSDMEIQAYCQRLTEITAAEGHIRLVQIYTVARKTPCDSVTALVPDALDRIAATVGDQTGLPVEVYR